jgi:hypothetical protein
MQKRDITWDLPLIVRNLQNLSHVAFPTHVYLYPDGTRIIFMDLWYENPYLAEATLSDTPAGDMWQLRVAN